jgi:L-malate glycosyltransferase
MKIAIISTMSGSHWGGSEYLWVATAMEALVQGHEVFISIYDWAISHPLVKALQDLGACILPRPRFIKPRSLFTRAIYRLVDSVKAKSISPYQSIFDYQPDVIFISQGSSYDALHEPDLLRLLYSYDISYVIICHFNSDVFLLDNTRREIIIKLFNKAKRVAFVAKSNLQMAERHLACNIFNAIVVKNPVNLQNRNLVEFPALQTISFACVARLETSCKGQDILLESFSHKVWKDRDWICRLYGNGPDHEYLESLAKFYQLSDRVQFMGHIDDIRSIWAESHILVLPSRGEGTPLALVEAMICGRPAVVTDIGGNAEWIEEGRTGFVAEAPTSKSFNLALERAWKNQNAFQHMGLTARLFAEINTDETSAKFMLQVIVNAPTL